MALSHPVARSPLLAGLRSVVIPGWGELSVTGSGTSRILVLLSLLLADVLIGALVLLGPLEVATGLVDPAVLLGILAVNLLVGFARLISTGHAWKLAGGRSLTVAVLLGALVLGPHMAVGWLTFEVRETLVTVFAGSPPPAPPGPLPAFGQTTSTTEANDITVPVLARSSSRGSAAVDMTVSLSTPPNPLGPRLNLLLLGGDAGPGRGGLRTDTVMVASINTITGDTAIFGLPRNLGDLRLTDGTPVPGLILNEVYGWANRHRRDRFPGPDPGAVAVADVVEHLTGLEIDHFMMVDLTGFADVVDAFGGVTVSVDAPVDGPLYNPSDGSYTMVRIPHGVQTLDGGLALAYARARFGSNDYVRMGRQRCILAAIAGKADVFSTVSRLPRLLGVMEQHLTTDIPVELLPELVRLGGRVRNGDIRLIGFGPDWSLGVNDHGQLVPDVARIRVVVKETLRSPSGSGAPAAGDACA